MQIYMGILWFVGFGTELFFPMFYNIQDQYKRNLYEFVIALIITTILFICFKIRENICREEP